MRKQMLCISIAILAMATTALAYQESCGLAECNAILEASEILSDVTLQDGTNTAIQIEFESSVAALQNPIVSAELCLYLHAGSPSSFPEFAVAHRMSDDAWDESSSAATINAMSVVDSTDVVLWSVQSGTTGCFDVTQIVDAVGSSLTLRLEWSNSSVSDVGAVLDEIYGTGLSLSSQYFSMSAEDRENTTGTGQTPYLTVVYENPSYLPFEPECTYSTTPVMAGWSESYDGINERDYCLYNSTVFHIKSGFYYNPIVGMYSESTTQDTYTTLNLVERGNIRSVWVRVTYYKPSYDGVCFAKQILPDGTYPNEHLVLLANHQDGFGEETTFDDAFFEVNEGMVCDEWSIIQFQVKDMTNDYGSSFAGVSKTVGTFSLEVGNIYISNIEVIGTDETIKLW
jgi:hypothetical protein